MTIVRDHVLAGRSFGSILELDAAFAAWVPPRRGARHRTHGEIIAVRAERDHAVLRTLPQQPCLVADRHLRHVGKDCLVAFEASLYSVPARRVRPRQLVEVRAAHDTVTIHALQPDHTGDTLLATHPRATGKGSWVIDQAHWDGLPDGHTRAVTTGEDHTSVPGMRPAPDEPNPLGALSNRSAAVQIPVARRPLADYDLAAGLPTASRHPELSTEASAQARATRHGQCPVTPTQHRQENEASTSADPAVSATMIGR